MFGFHAANDSASQILECHVNATRCWRNALAAPDATPRKEFLDIGGVGFPWREVQVVYPSNVKVFRLASRLRKAAMLVFLAGWVGSNWEHAMRQIVRSFLKDESGATAIEYGLIAAGISVAIIAVVQGLGTNLNTTFGSVQTALK
jgi:pilus assembly protein Flp/PilA